MKVESEAYWSADAQEIQPRILLMTRIGWHSEGAELVAVELQARQIAMEAQRKLTPNIREIRAICGCIRNILIHSMLQVRTRALVNNPG